MGTPSMIPTEMAAQASVSGWAVMPPRCTTRVKASWSATYPPQIEAVRGPPAAWGTAR